MTSCLECKNAHGEDEIIEVATSADDILDAQSVKVLEVHRNLHGLRQDGLLCDGKVLVGKKVFPVHKNLLAAESPYFRALFTGGLKESGQEEVNAPTDDHVVMETIINYIYTRRIDLTHMTLDSVFHILSMADLLLITDLKEMCDRYLLSQLKPCNVFEIRDFAERFSRDLHKKVEKYILDNFYQISMRSPDFTKLPLEEIASYLQDDRLNIVKEEKGFEAMMKWMNNDPIERKRHLPRLLRSLRLGFIHADYFLDNISRDPFISNCVECGPIIKSSWECLYRLEKYGNRNTDFRNPLIRPRIPRDVVFAIGGWSGGSPISFFETYDSRCDRWYTHSLLEDNSPRAYHGMVTYKGKVYIVGGFDGSQYFNSVKCFDPVKKKWAEVAPMYHQRCYVSAVVLGGAIYACGGYDGRWRMKSVEKYIPEQNQWIKVANMAQRRSDAGCDALLGKLYVSGGFDGQHCLSTTEVYVPETNQWTTIRSMSVPRSGVSLVTYQSHLYALGGFDGESRLLTMERLCPETNVWTEMPEMYAARSNFATLVMDDLIFAIGGFNGTHTVPHVECYDGKLNEWYDATDMNINRSALRAVVIRDLPNTLDYTHYGHSKDIGGDSSKSRESAGASCKMVTSL